jgi:hypothetical protein
MWHGYISSEGIIAEKGRECMATDVFCNFLFGKDMN